MRKTIIVLGCLSLGLAHAQQDFEKRVGINTENPRASLEVKATQFNGITQGILFPHIDEDEKARWTKSEDKGLVAGTVIWNTTKLCLDYFDGTNWQCTDGTKTNVHPNKWVQGPTSFTGTAIWGDEAGEIISIAKDNCPTGQAGVSLNYPANASQYITYTATSTVSQEDANQKAIDLMNSAQKQQERQSLAQEYANQNGQCENPPKELVSCTKPSWFNTSTYVYVDDVKQGLVTDWSLENIKTAMNGAIPRKSVYVSDGVEVAIHRRSGKEYRDQLHCFDYSDGDCYPGIRKGTCELTP